MIHPIRTERGTLVAATAVPGVGVVVEEMGGSTATRIILNPDAAKDLAEQIDLAILASLGRVSHAEV